MVNKDIIKGSLGPATVVIPESRILSTCIDNKTKYRIEKDTKVRCKCIDVHIDMSKCFN
jgi:hypothetical protein